MRPKNPPQQRLVDNCTSSLLNPIAPPFGEVRDRFTLGAHGRIDIHYVSLTCYNI